MSLNIPNAKLEVLEQSQQIYEVLGYPLTVEIRGENLSLIQKKAKEIFERLKSLPEVKKIQIRNSYEKSVMHVKIDRNKSLMSGVVAGQVFLDLQTYMLGKNIGTLRTNQGTLPIVLKKAETVSLEDLPKTPLEGLKGEVPLGTIATVSQKTVPSVIDHSDGERVVYVDLVSIEAVSYTHLTLPTIYSV